MARTFYMNYTYFQEILGKLEERKERDIFVREALRSKKYLHIFGRFFFPNIIQGEIEAPECHLDLIRELSSPETSAIIFPRGFSKTTWEKIDTIHDIVYRLEPVIVYCALTLTDAGFHFESIKSELENNRLLIQVYGDLVPPPSDLGVKWTNTHFQTTNGINVIARGAGRGRGINIKNQRPTKIILDDIEDDDMVRSNDQLEKMNHWIMNVILPSLDKQRGRVKMIGTVLSANCQIQKFYKKFGGIKRKAIEEYKSIWPAMFSIKDLMEIKNKLGSRVFAQEYMNEPVNEELSTIKRQWVENNVYSILEHTELMRYSIMMDPQAGEKEGSDYYGLAVVGWYPRDPHRYIMEVHSGKAGQIEQAALLVSTWQRYGPRVQIVGVEKVLSQVAVYQLVLAWKSGKFNFDPKHGIDNTNRNIPFTAVSPAGRDKVARLQMHEAAFERGEIHVHSGLSAFIDNLVAFPQVDHDDDVDAVIYSLDNSNKNSVASDKSSAYTDRDNTTAGLLTKHF